MTRAVRRIFDRSSDLNPRNMRLGMYAWLIQRITGLYLVLFLFTHIAAITQANFGITSGFQVQMFDVLRNPFYIGGSAALVFDLIALGIVAFHGVNGIRIVLLDLGFGVRKHRVGFWISMIGAIAISSYIIFLGLPLLRGG